MASSNAFADWQVQLWYALEFSYQKYTCIVHVGGHNIPKLGEVVPHIALSVTAHQFADKDARACIPSSAAGMATAKAFSCFVLKLSDETWGRRSGDRKASWGQQT